MNAHYQSSLSRMFSKTIIAMKILLYLTHISEADLPVSQSTYTETRHLTIETNTVTETHKREIGRTNTKRHRLHFDHDYIVLQPRHAFESFAHSSSLLPGVAVRNRQKREKKVSPPYTHLVPSCDFARSLDRTWENKANVIK
jgi:hypothetical protein